MCNSVSLCLRAEKASNLLVIVSHHIYFEPLKWCQTWKRLYPHVRMGFYLDLSTDKSKLSVYTMQKCVWNPQWELGAGFCPGICTSCILRITSEVVILALLDRDLSYPLGLICTQMICSAITTDRYLLRAALLRDVGVVPKRRSGEGSEPQFNL